MTSSRKYILAFLVLNLSLPFSLFAQTSTSGTLLSAFFSVNNALPNNVRSFCKDGPDMDSLPVVASDEIDETTLDPEDFEVTLLDGSKAVPICASLRPADEANENRTIHLIGEFGDPVTNPAITVKVVGDLRGEVRSDGLTPIFLDAEESVTALASGPAIVFAEKIITTELELADTTTTMGTACPRTGTKQALRIMWDGSVTKDGATEITDTERVKFRVVLRLRDGSRKRVTPFAMGDLNDGDNVQDLCLKQGARPISVRVKAGAVADPNGDLNATVSSKIRR